MLTDTHCHLDSEAFDADRAAVVERARGAGLTHILTPGVNVVSSEHCQQLAADYDCIYAAVGVHPTEAKAGEPDAFQRIRNLAQHPKVVAIGEIGLDYHWVTDPVQQARQRQVLRTQLALASELRKPVILHARNKQDAQAGPCLDDLLSLLEQWLSDPATPAELRSRPGVLHSFSGSMELAQRALGLGFYIGVTGPITFKNAAARRSVIAQVPLERLLIETDSPYLAPHPYRGQRNEPAYVAHIADKIADVQSRTTQEVIAVTGENAARLFSWGETG